MGDGSRDDLMDDAAPGHAKRLDCTWIVGIDGSDDSIQALKWAGAHAPRRAATIRIVRSWTYAAGRGIEFASPIVLEEVRPATAYESIDELTAEMRESGVSVESEVVFGSAAPVLLEASADADLLIVGTRGKGGFARLLLGSTSHQCATHARVPVLVVPRDAPSDGSISEIVVGMDTSPGARAALAWAFEFAPDDVPIRVVGAWHQSRFDVPASEDGEEQARGRFDAAIDEAELAAGRHGGTRRHFDDGHPASMLMDGLTPSSLLVVGERGQRGLKAALLGSVATEVLHRAPGPVAIVPVGD
jgi:nucleotide-binding universal stress UspA family protein